MHAVRNALQLPKLLEKCHEFQLHPTYTQLIHTNYTMRAPQWEQNYWLGVKDTTPLSGLMHACRKTPQGALNSNCCNSLKNITNYEITKIQI